MSFIRFTALISSIFATSLDAQSVTQVTPADYITSKEWSASWVAPQGPHAREYGVHHFRKSFELATKPIRFLVHISADNRYRLFVNGTPVHIGPARGDIAHWRFDSLDIAPFLVPGSNVIAATVWNFGTAGPVAQETDQTAFILQGDDDVSSIANTDASWRVFTNPAYTPITDFGAKLQTYIVVGPGDNVAGPQYPWGWETPSFDDHSWTAAQMLRPGKPRGIGTDGKWLLVPRQIPLMESKPIRLKSVRRSEGLTVPDGFVQGKSPLEVPPHTTVTILLDQAEITTAYPELLVSGGQGSTIKLTYAESLYTGPAALDVIKANRDEISGKYLRGFEDQFQPDGGDHRLFRPLRWRTWRYLQLEITTRENALTVHDLTGEFSAYPFTENAKFSSSDSDLSDIWEIAWRTIRTGTHEIFTDSPYYEQLSYVGDTRIEALISLYVSGDDRPMRKAIEAFGERRNANGLTTSRWPDSRHQIIPPYSLVWISMVHDYWQLRDDPEFVSDQLPAVREVLRYFSEHSDHITGSFTAYQWWNFVDWIPAWGKDAVTGLGGVPPRDAAGTSAILDLQHVYTLQHAAELFTAFGLDHDATVCRDRARKIRANIIASCWDNTRQLLADTPEKKTFSQHANTYLILTAGDKKAELTDLARRVRDEPDLAPATFYFTFYTHKALALAGLADDYTNWLGQWRNLLDLGLTTVPETPEPDSRSDSHGWGAHPMLGMLETICGITPLEPGFKSVRIAPRLGPLKFVRGTVPHPLGLIEVDLKRAGESGLTGTVTLPAGLTGQFEWNGQVLPLQAGVRDISF